MTATTARSTAPAPPAARPTPEPAAGTARPSTFAALRVRNYRLYFGGQVVSNTGTWISRIAQDWLVLQLTGSPLAVGITTALQFAPMAFFGLWGGLIADRYSKRRLLMITQVVMAVLATVLAVLALTGLVQVWHVYAVALGIGLVTVVDNPARQTFVNEMVPRDLVRNAVSLNVGNFQMARLVGPAVAGVLISAVGVGLAFTVNAVTFAVVFFALAAIRTRELVPSAVAPRGRGQVREALRYAMAEPRVRWPIVLIFFVGTFGFNWPIILSAYTLQEFGGQAQVYGWLNTALAVGSLAGALLAARTTTSRLSVQFAAAVGVGVLILAMGLAPGMVVFVLLLVGTGVVSILFNSLNNSTVQLATDPLLRGRVMSIYMLVFMGGIPVGSLIIGAVTDAFGPDVSQTISGTIIIVAALVSGIVAMRRAGLRPHLDLHRESGHLMTITPVDERVRAA